MGSVVALTTTACGGQFAPYGLRQWSYTTTLVATQGLWNPEASWSIGLARCSEICIGIAVTTTVQFALWPRYARREFLCGVREILSDIAGDFSARAAFQRCRQVLQAQLLALSTASQAPAETASEAFVHAREEIHAMGWSVKDTLAGLLWVARAEKSYRLTEKLPRSRSTLALEELPTDTAL